MPLRRTYHPAAMMEQEIESLLVESKHVIFSTPFSRGREKGFIFGNAADDRNVYVSEYRSSDAIYCVPSKSSWGTEDSDHDNAMSFEWGSYRTAAEWVLTTLLGEDWRDD